MILSKSRLNVDARLYPPSPLHATPLFIPSSLNHSTFILAPGHVLSGDGDGGSARDTVGLKLSVYTAAAVGRIERDGDGGATAKRDATWDEVRALSKEMLDDLRDLRGAAPSEQPGSDGGDAVAPSDDVETDASQTVKDRLSAWEAGVRRWGAGGTADGDGDGGGDGGDGIGSDGDARDRVAEKLRRINKRLEAMIAVVASATTKEELKG